MYTFSMEKIWKIKGEFSGDVIADLFAVRGLTQSESAFLNPLLPESIFDCLEWKLNEAVELIRSHIAKGSAIFIHGDYDVDGICATAILYKTIYYDLNYKNCFYFIPDRFEDGYGLSVGSIDKLKSDAKSKLLITVDCGITAVKECEYVMKKGFDVIISDHHQPSQIVPNPTVLLWTDQLTGAGISLAMSSKLVGVKDEYLAFAALATVADIQPVLGLNRSIVKYGLEKLNDFPNLGLSKLLEVAGVNKKLSTYDLGWVISPRLNAAGRLESALDSLKLLCTDNEIEARELAEKLNRLNQQRQQNTLTMVDHARGLNKSAKKIIIAADSSYHEGVIGLVAGKLAQEFYRPAVAISVGAEFSKGSARSVEGVNIVELLRKLDIYENVGGHPMAAGFTLKTIHLAEFKQRLEELAESISPDLLNPVLTADLELPLTAVSLTIAQDLLQFEPFGLGNPEPVFVSRNLKVLEARPVGNTGAHLKLRLANFADLSRNVSAIFFGGGKMWDQIMKSNLVDVAYLLKENTYNGFSSPDLQIKDIKLF